MTEMIQSRDAEAIWDGTRSLLNSYKLYAVITHVGTMETGHYTAYICHRDKWYHMDDQKVSEATVMEVLKSHAYMLFYAKKTIVCSS